MIGGPSTSAICGPSTTRALIEVVSPSIIAGSSCSITTSSNSISYSGSTNVAGPSNVDILEGVKAHISNLHDMFTSKEETETKSKVKNIFKCVICYENRRYIYFCSECCRFLGCYSCLKRVKECPLCRRNFSMPVKAYFIPGIDDIIELRSEPENLVPLPPPQDGESESDGDGGAYDDTIPIN